MCRHLDLTLRHFHVKWSNVEAPRAAGACTGSPKQNLRNASECFVLPPKQTGHWGSKLCPSGQGEGSSSSKACCHGTREAGSSRIPPPSVASSILLMPRVGISFPSLRFAPLVFKAFPSDPSGLHQGYLQYLLRHLGSTLHHFHSSGFASEIPCRHLLLFGPPHCST